METLFKDFGIAAALSLSAVGSALGTGAAAMGAIGSWKKCYSQNKAAPALLTAFIGFPMSQTIYGIILMLQISKAVAAGHVLMGIGIFGGLGMGASAMMQGRAAAAACDALSETGKGTGNYILALGIIESVALFVMVFLLLQIGPLTQ
jgi:V/A-type H+-transporting ATPase subunit K